MCICIYIYIYHICILCAYSIVWNSLCCVLFQDVTQFMEPAGDAFHHLTARGSWGSCHASPRKQWWLMVINGD